MKRKWTAALLWIVGAGCSVQTANEAEEAESEVVAGASSTLAVGDGFSCAVSATGGVKCWGMNDEGQLGDGTTTYRPALGDVVGLTSGVKAVTAGKASACALTNVGGVKCWGYNGFGQLGDGNRGIRTSPVDVVGLTSGVKMITVGRMHSCAVTTAGALKCWGYNRLGQLGDGTTIDRYTPVDVVGLGAGVKSVAVTGKRTCALLQSGAVKCWGSMAPTATSEGGLGTAMDPYPSEGSKELAPVDVPSLTSGVKALAGSASGNVICALKGGSALCWGRQENHQFDNGFDGPRMTPIATGPTSKIRDVSLSRSTCVLMQGGSVQCWGVNDFGQRGDGTFGNGPQLPRPVEPVMGEAVPGLVTGVDAREVAVGDTHACARLKVGGVKCWGAQNFGAYHLAATPEVIPGL